MRLASALPDTRGGFSEHLRIHRDLLQSAASAFHARLSNPRRSRAASTTLCLTPSPDYRGNIIYAFPHFDGVSLKLSTGLKIHPGLWSTKRQRARTGSAIETELNHRLDFIAQTLKLIYLQLLNAGEQPTPEAIKQRYRPAAESAPPKDIQISPLDGYDAFLDAKQGRLQPGSLQVHRTARKHLKEFGEKGKLTIGYDQMDRAFLDKFINYLLHVVNLNNTTAKKVITTIGTYL